MDTTQNWNANFSSKLCIIADDTKSNFMMNRWQKHPNKSGFRGIFAQKCLFLMVSMVTSNKQSTTGTTYPLKIMHRVIENILVKSHGINVKNILFRAILLNLLYLNGGHFEIQDGRHTIARKMWVPGFLKSVHQNTPICQFSCFLPKVNILAIFCYISAPLLSLMTFWNSFKTWQRGHGNHTDTDYM